MIAIGFAAIGRFDAQVCKMVTDFGVVGTIRMG
jgi:hypothetical protein